MTERHPAEARDPNRKRNITYFGSDTDKPAKQSFKDQCDINKIMKKAQVSGTISHLAKYAGQYGDFTDFDYEESLNLIAEAQSMFYELPAELRVNEFRNNPQNFLHFVQTNTPEQIAEKLPQFALPGRQYIDPIGGRLPPAEAPSAPSTPPQKAENPPSADPPTE